jgi:hypothetical protein
MNPLDRFAQSIIYLAQRHYERIFLFSGVTISLTVLLRLFWLAAYQPLLSNTDAPIPAIDSSERPLQSPARDTGQIADGGQLAGRGNQVFKIMLPERFRGCWQGVAVLDSQRQLSSRGLAVKWSPKSYRICFGEQDLDLWQLHYGENRIDANSSGGFEREQTVDFLQAEGATAMLRASVVPRSRMAGKYTTHEETTLYCELAAEHGAVMRVSGDVVVDMNGKPWREARWHASFARAGAPASARAIELQSHK